MLDKIPGGISQICLILYMPLGICKITAKRLKLYDLRNFAQNQAKHNEKLVRIQDINDKKTRVRLLADK